jgi:hypothetical protein
MHNRALATYLLFWLVLMVLAVLNGVLREATFGRTLPELRAHQLSTLTGMVILAVAVWLLSLWRAPGSAREAAMIGLAWLLFTVVFEFTFGRLVAGHSWQRLLQDYDLAAGRVWPVFLLWISLLPWAVFLLHRRPPG